MNSNSYRTQQQMAQGGWQARWLMLKGAPRVIILGAFILAIFGLLLRQVWIMQFVQGDYYRARAARQSTELVTIPAARGVIYDASGLPLVRNVPSFNVVLVPAYLPDDEIEAENVLIRLAWMLNIPYATSAARAGEEPKPGLRETVEARGWASYYPVMVKRGVSRETAMMVAQQSLLLPGVFIEEEAVRDYPYGSLVSQILGYLLPIPGERAEEYRAEGYDPATDRVGMAGVEYTYEELLRGQKGRQIVEKDVYGRVSRIVAEESAPAPGHNVHLTLDLELQKFVAETLQAAMDAPNVRSPRGVAIVMNPQTGEIKALVSLPTYDNNIFTREPMALGAELERLYADIHRPMLNHAITDRLQPGSVFKVVIAAAALQEGVLNGRRTRLNCPGKITIPNKYAPNEPGLATDFFCWNRGGHGWMDVVTGIAHSCNVFFYKVGGGFEEDHFEGLGVERIAKYARLFGFGEPTGVELVGEESGVVPTADWKRLTFGESWNTGNTYHLAIGEGYLEVTPLQMLNAVNAIANGGTLYRPRIVHHVTDAQGNVVQPFTPEIIRTLPISAEHLSLVREGMLGAIEYGTAQNVQIEGVRVYGKTGTAQYCDDIARKDGLCEKKWPEHAWFAAYAAREDAELPEVSVIVFVYHGGEGSATAAPVAHDILQHYFGLDQPPAGGEASGASAP